jgi:hypothetical protein
MSTLPDLSTQDPGLVAFWNAIEQSTEDSINPADVTSDGNVLTQTIYDNGIEGEYDIPHNTGGHNCYYRVKTDGWIIVYLESEDQANYGKNNSNTHGQFDVVDKWSDVNNNSTPGRNWLEISVESLGSELSNWSTISNYYNTSDVGIYSFDWPNANGVTIFSEKDEGKLGNTATVDIGMIPTQGTTVHHFSIVGDTHTEGGAHIKFEGNDLVKDHKGSGSRNMLPLLGGSMTPGQEYTGVVDVAAYERGTASAVLIWE